MVRLPRLLFGVAVGATVVILVGAKPASACGSHGYSYAGVTAPTYAFGISATVTPLDAFDILNGHVAGWVGVGGPGEGPNGTDEWLEVGLSGFPGVKGSDVYYEVALPNRNPTYHQLAANIPVGRAVRVAVVEMHGRPDWWRVWLNGHGASRPIRLPGSYLRWNPIATAEGWDGGSGGACNTFLYRFRRVLVAHAPGGGWRPLTGGAPITSRVTRIRRSPRGSAFLAAEGAAAFRLLDLLNP